MKPLRRVLSGKIKEMKYLVAVSGGVDSVVLLDMLVKRRQSELIVAHFDHGIRLDSRDDATFVKALAKKYGLQFVSKREELGARASEELARKQRYAFLRNEAKKHAAGIVTAHHRNDLIETIAINIYRGTGWRGVAVFGAKEIVRPLLGMRKAELYDYALKNGLEWVEDSTNHEQTYLRNRMRAKLAVLPDVFEENLVRLWKEQTLLADKIDEETHTLLKQPYSRYFFVSIEPAVALELLRALIRKEVGTTFTHPQLERALLAIKTAQPGTVFQVGDGVAIQFRVNSFIVVPPQRML